jgi:hypothetical protein
MPAYEVVSLGGSVIDAHLLVGFEGLWAES